MNSAVNPTTPSPSLADGLPGYRWVEQLYSDPRTLVYRAIREADHHPVVVKLLQRDYPNFNELLQFRNQYSIAKNLHLSGVVVPYSLEAYHNSYALIMEDFSGISLKEYLKTSVITLDEWLSIALQMADILNGLYCNRVIHKDLKPANILINPDTKQIKLIDFSISSLLPRETQALQPANGLEGTLSYIAPEQTGRMNRGIDYRSDFYSLGITLFELLTRQLPFPAKNPMELLHCHVARQPPTAHSLDANIPLVISQIIGKLMAKNAEDRYQSALGLKYDLQFCQQELQTNGSIAWFELGQHDVCDRFLVPEKLYGREQEVAELLAAFDRVAGNSQVNQGMPHSELVLVAGFSGIGKTAVVNEVHKPIAKGTRTANTRQHGYFIKGKFDQLQRNVPFSAFVQAFRDLMRQLLGESDAQLAHWKTTILSALGESGQVIIQVIPELEQIIGSQPVPAELAGDAAQNRFNLLFQKFIQIFTAPDHPLVIFLDDLQWSDTGSLKLIQLLMGETNTGYLLLIGAYRDNEVSVTHPLTQILNDVSRMKAVVKTITLKPLSQTDLNCLVADTLHCSEDLAKPLTELVYCKTKGNPFFTAQFLKVLHEESWITFDHQIGYWQCDIAQIRSLSLTDDVVEFMAQQLQKLSGTAQTVLKLAACIGNQFDLATLAIVYEKSQAETASDLWSLLQAGLVLPTSEVYKFFQTEAQGQETKIENPLLSVEHENSELAKPHWDSSMLGSGCAYKFLHDRVQQAAYSLIPDWQKQSTHYKIGQLLLSNTPEDDREDKIFDIVNNLNQGLPEVIQPDIIQPDIIQPIACHELAQLNLMAGRKAKAATAYEAAYAYLNTGIALLATDGWQAQYSLMLMLHQLAAEVAFLNGEFEASQHWADVVLDQARTLLDRVKIYEIQIYKYLAQQQPLQALKMGLYALQLLGVNLPSTSTEHEIGQAIAETLNMIPPDGIEQLADLPPMTDPLKLAAMQIAFTFAPVAVVAAPQLFVLSALAETRLSMQYGNAPMSAAAYAHCGVVFCTLPDRIKAGHQFGQLALKLASQLNHKAIHAKVCFVVGSLILPWKVHLKESLSLLQQGHEDGLETGSLEIAAFSDFYKCQSAYLLGQELSSLAQSLSVCSQRIRQIKQSVPLDCNELLRQVVLNLLGTTDNPCWIVGAACDEVQLLAQFQEHNVVSGLGLLCIHQLFLHYLFGQYSQALEKTNLAATYAEAFSTQPIFPFFYFYDSLVRSAIYPACSASEQTQLLKQIAANQEKMHDWAQHAPMNYLHRFYLVSAEQHRILNQKIEAIDCYDRAIAGAKTQGYIQEEALANELAAKFYLEWGKERIAQDYLHNAYYSYARWGAVAKIHHLEHTYPGLLTPILQQESVQLGSELTIQVSSLLLSTQSSTGRSSASSSNSVSAALDLATLLKAFQALSSEIQLEQLLTTLLQVVIENAGADKCALLLLQQGNLLLEAITVLTGDATVLQSIPVEETQDLPITLINSVKRTLQAAVIVDATNYPSLMADPYIVRQQPKSLLCAPMIHQGKLLGILYLENNLATGAFTHDRVELLNLLSTQAAISLENARLYQQSQTYGQQLEQKSQELTQTLQDLKTMQLQLVQNEKMSALGNLVAGVAHEINNPLGFIAGNLEPARTYVEDLFRLIDLYEQTLPEPGTEIADEIVAIDLAYLREDLPKLIDSMKLGVERMRGISTSLRTFSRADKDYKVPFDIHEGLDSTILILKHRLKAADDRAAIEVVKAYGNLPLIQCFPGQLNQVFMNILANAIDALAESRQRPDLAALPTQPGRITIRTELINSDRNSNAAAIPQIIIRIADNGIGMTDAVQQRIFDYLFTTKAVGQGTGLGLAIAHQIVVDKHGGTITVHSAPGQGTEFSIALPLG